MNKDRLNIVFFGTPDFAIPALKVLINNERNVSAVFTGHGPVKIIAQEQGIKVFQPTSLKKDDRVFEEFKSLNPDLCVITAYGKIIPRQYLDIPKYGFINIHPSLLPKYRGPSPVQTAILNGDEETGVTIMIVDEEIDHGPILANEKFKIKSEKYYPEVVRDLAEIGAKLLIETIPRYIKEEIEARPQEHKKATFTKMFKREDGRINWNNTAETIYNQVRALNPEPGTWTTWFTRRSLDEGRKGKVINILNVTTCDIVNSQETTPRQVPGTVIKVNGNIAVATKTCYLILKSIQLEGGKVMDAKSFVNGHPDFLNSKLE